jgi:rhamnosyltransferase
MKRGCSIVIRAFNEQDHIGRLMEGVHQQTVKDVEVILVDSGSTDDTKAIALQHGARLVQIPPEHFTFGKSLNMGIAEASHDIVVLASAHVYPVYPDWLEKLIEPFADSKTALSYGKQRGSRTSRFSEQQIYSRWYPDQSDLKKKIPFCNNANAAIRRSIWQGHRYDETLTGLEDLAWAKWACEQGYTIAYVAEAEIVHVHHETRHGVYNRYLREAMAFKRIYPESHFSLYDLLRTLLSSIGFDLLHALRAHSLWNNLAGILWFRWWQFWGTYMGYRRFSLLTPELRQTFYYHVGWKKTESQKRPVEPIRYND